jgi:hypothetical protein
MTGGQRSEGSVLRVDVCSGSQAAVRYGALFRLTDARQSARTTVETSVQKYCGFTKRDFRSARHLNALLTELESRGIVSYFWEALLGQRCAGFRRREWGDASLSPSQRWPVRFSLELCRKGTSQDAGRAKLH